MAETKKKIESEAKRANNTSKKKPVRKNTYKPKPIEMVTILVRHEGVAAEIMREIKNGKYNTRYFIYPQINGGIPFEIECDVQQRVPVEIAALLKPLIAVQNRRLK